MAGTSGCGGRTDSWHRLRSACGGQARPFELRGTTSVVRAKAASNVLPGESRPRGGGLPGRPATTSLSPDHVITSKEQR